MAEAHGSRPGLSKRLWRFAKLLLAAELALGGAFAAFMLWSPAGGAAGVYQSPPLEYSALYEPQKTVFHINGDGGWFGRIHGHRLTNLENQVNAVGEISLEAVVVLHGNGLDLLADAMKDSRLAARIDELRKAGVKFVVCRQSMIGRRLEMAKLYGLKPEQLVAYGVPELVRYQQKGFTYVRL